MEEFLQESVFRGEKWGSIYECIDSFLRENRMKEEVLFSKVFARVIEVKHNLPSKEADKIEEIFLEELKKGRDVRDLFLRSLEDPDYIFKKPDIPEDIVNLLTEQMDENKLKELILANKLFRKSGLRHEVVKKARKQNTLTKLLAAFPKTNWRWDYIFSNPNADYELLLPRAKKMNIYTLVHILANPNLSLVEMKKLFIANYPETDQPSKDNPGAIITGRDKSRLMDDGKPLTFTDLEILSDEYGDDDLLDEIYADFFNNPRILINFKEVIAKYDHWTLPLLATRHFTMDEFPFVHRGDIFNSPDDFSNREMMYFSQNPHLTLDIIKKYKDKKWDYGRVAENIKLDQETINYLVRKIEKHDNVPADYLSRNKSLTNELLEKNKEIFRWGHDELYGNPNIDWRVLKRLFKHRKFYIGNKTFKLKDIKKLGVVDKELSYILSFNENLTYEYIRDNPGYWYMTILSKNNFGRRIKTRETMMV